MPGKDEMQQCPFRKGEPEEVWLFPVIFGIPLNRHNSTEIYMTLGEILDSAIRNEIKSQHLYRHLASVVAGRGGALFMQRLAEEELGHELRLRRLRSEGDVDIDLELHHPLMGEEVDRSHAVYVTIDEAASVEDLLELAARREERARLLYERLSALMQESEAAGFFSQLALDERAHESAVRRIADEIRNRNAAAV
jgi:rubrerythrin